MGTEELSELRDTGYWATDTSSSLRAMNGPLDGDAVMVDGEGKREKGEWQQLDSEETLTLGKFASANCGT